MPLPVYLPLRHGKWRWPTWNEASYPFAGAKGFAEEKGKPVISTGAGCPGRVNPQPDDNKLEATHENEAKALKSHR